MKKLSRILPVTIVCVVVIVSGCSRKESDRPAAQPQFKLIASPKFLFNSFVDCNMAEAWIGDTFRIFPGKYGEDPVWGYANELNYADGKNADEAFLRKSDEFKVPKMPLNSPVGSPGLHGAVWFETVYQDQTDTSGKTLFAVYHNENYPATLPFDEKNGTGYKNEKWPEGLTGPESAAAVCRIGVMKSTDGGMSWENKGLFIEDLQPRMILLPHNNSLTFAGGVGDPSAVAAGDYLYLFYGEYGYQGDYREEEYDSTKEWSGQCISVARIKLKDLDHPEGAAKRWNGHEFSARYNEVGMPIPSLQIPQSEGGGGASHAGKKFYWGPSVSWNNYLNCWVMLMARAEGKSWKGSSLYISFNPNQDLGSGDNSQAWSKPQLLLNRPGHILWYPSLQPMNTPEDIEHKYTSLRLGKKARLFFKDMEGDNHQYLSEYIVEFEK